MFKKKQKAMMICGPWPEYGREGYSKVACTQCKAVLWASPEAQEIKPDFWCIDCAVAVSPNSLPKVLPKSVDRIREVFGEDGVQETEEYMKMPIRELGVESLKDPRRWA